MVKLPGSFSAKPLLLALALFIVPLLGLAQTPPAKTLPQILTELQKQPDNLSLKLDAAKAYLKKGSTDTAEVLLNEITLAATQTNNARAFIQANISLGRMYADKGENVKSLGIYQKALDKADNIGDKLSTAHVYKGIGALYISWKKFDDALAYYEKAEILAREVNNAELVADCQNNKGTVYEQQEKYDKAIVAYKNALDVYTQQNIPAKISMALSNVAIVYKYQKNYAASLQYNFKAIDLSLKTGDEWMMAATYNNIGNLYGELGDFKNAKLYCEKSIAIATKINAIEIVESAYDSMGDAAAKAGDYKSAFEYHKLYAQTKDKFINLDNTRQLSELNVKFETERKQKLIQQQQFEISRKNYWLFGSVILLILGVSLAFLIIRKNKYKQEKLLQAEVFKQQEIANRSLFEGEQKERIRIARDLHDSIGQMLSVIKMNISVLQPQDAEVPAVNNALNLVDKTINEVRHISHNLIPEGLNFGLFAALEDLCEKVNSAGGTEVMLNVPEDIRQYQFAKPNELSIYRIVQEVLNNMMRHAQATHIDIDIVQKESNLTLSIRDNGKGFDASKIDESKGIGWKNIAARVNLLDGKMQVQSEQLKGTQIEIFIPGM
jgi:two-component system NarL family sensor kinase